MASQKILDAKKAQVANIKANLENSKATVIVDARGLTVTEDTELRAELRKAGVKYEVLKNSLVEKAIAGTEMEGLTSILKGPSAIATSENDYTAAAKILSQYAKKFQNLEVKGGYCEGEVLDAKGVDKLGNIPGREQLLSMLLSALTGNIRGFAVAVKAVAEKKEQA